ncbi:TBC1 domain family member 15 [Toxocara canis]|uniref:TBC1 domain family member 15 n=1 Tax=Toxocara canis TaxID=6265 RepID=A0A0B2W2N6_TOXCA|nr:TBC1 domain family member 15 [Toxocara canis]
MIPAYLIYRHYQKKKENPTMDSIRGCEFTYLSSLINDRETFSLQGVAAKRISEGEENEECFINGKLSLVEKANGVMIDWCPIEEDGWVLTNGDDADTSLSRTPDSGDSRQDTNSMKFSVDIKDLRSFQCVEPKKGCPWIRFISKDGAGYIPLYFRQGGISSFIEHLQREQSVSILNLNSDFFSRIMAQPYATAMTGLGKVADFVQDQVISSLLDSDPISAEEQIKAMRELREQEEEAAGRLRLHNDAGFELVTQLDLPQRPEFSREKPLTEDVWKRHKNSDGSFKDVHSLKVLIFRGGLTPSLRKEAWKYLLGVYDWNKSAADNFALKKKHEEDYFRMKLQWKTISADQESRFSGFSARRAQIDKDVVRTDRTHSFFGGNDNVNVNMLSDILMTYCMYNFDLGYVQGMSDYLSPLLVIMQNEVDAFWAFVALMQRVHGNFEMDQVIMKKQLMDLRDLLMVVNPTLANYLESHQSDDMYFCFRWVLVSFKREFSFDDILKLWEVLWTDLPCANFHLLMCVAILDKQMNFITENKFGLTEILKHVNDLSMNIDLDETLTSAEAIFHQLAASQNKLPKHLCNILSLGCDVTEETAQ